jgi:hypothetical protein
MPDQARFLDFMDMIDGGGKGRRGDKFEDGGIFSALANLVATPYGSEDPARAARRDAVYRSAGLLSAEQEPAPAPTATPTVRRTKPTRNELMSARAAEMERQRGLQQDVYDPRGPNQMPPVTPVPASGYPNMNMPAIAGYTTPFTGQMTQPSVLSGGAVQPIPAGSQSANISAGGLFSAPNMPVREGLPLPRDAEGILAPELPASERNSELISFNRRMESVPEMLRGTEAEMMYRDYLLSGGIATFPQFTSGSITTEDGSVLRSPTPPALTPPRAEVLPTTPVAPQPKPKSVSDLPYADQIVAARQAVMREQITPDMLQSMFGIDFAREVMSGIQMMGGKTAVPNIPLGPLSIQRLHQTMPITRFN